MGSEFDYINRTYGLSIERGTPVVFEGDRPGTVTRGSGQYIYILFKGDKRERGPFHPTWMMEYPAQEPTP